MNFYHRSIRYLGLALVALLLFGALTSCSPHVPPELKDEQGEEEDPLITLHWHHVDNGDLFVYEESIKMVLHRDPHGHFILISNSSEVHAGEVLERIIRVGNSEYEKYRALFLNRQSPKLEKAPPP